MATTNLRAVCDAGPLIHLDEIGCLDLLHDFDSILIPRVVWEEVSRHRTSLKPEQVPKSHFVDPAPPALPSAKLSTLSESLLLGAGERAALLLMEHHPNQMLLLCDDAAARLAAESLGMQVRGTIGVLTRSIRLGRRTSDQVIHILRNFSSLSSLYISSRLLTHVIQEIEREES